MNQKNFAERNAAILLLIFTLATWQAICFIFSVSEFIFPSPYQITLNLIEFKGEILRHAWT
ncbi:MAG: putative aliphatic sulfonates transport permease protein SsuC, partial [Pseudomonadota bacterium]